MAETQAIHHKGLTAGRWHAMSLVEQMGNIGSEVGRAIGAKERGNSVRQRAALDRALELLDLTTEDPKLVHRLKEIRRAREVVVDFLADDNRYGSTASSLDSYFKAFALAARRGR